MIQARRLFLTPALGTFLILIPFIGLVLWFIVIMIWYIKNQDDIHNYFRGINYRVNEYNEDDLKEFT
ncbi:MAG: hypothetical protein GWN56_05770 [Nitrosopumilaceae archaeon]|nr:hypothetical protein [Nitrosopumilaceae archaeon]